eukprot:COSAG04_NODE_5003_length_1784_cov_1.626706_1_plen_172_part_10
MITDPDSKEVVELGPAAKAIKKKEEEKKAALALEASKVAADKEPANVLQQAAEPKLAAVAECCATIEDPVSYQTRTKLEGLLREAVKECLFADVLQDQLERSGFHGSERFLYCDLATKAATLRRLGEVCGKLALAKTWDEAFQMVLGNDQSGPVDADATSVPAPHLEPEPLD